MTYSGVTTGVLSFCFVAAMFNACSADAQSAGQLQSKSERRKSQVHKLVIAFKEDDSLQSFAVSPVFEYPIQCAEDGTAFIRTMEPPQFTNSRIYGISRTHGVRQYNQELIKDLYDIQLRGYFASNNEVLFLVYGTQDDRKRTGLLRLPSGETKEQTVFSGEHRYFISVFDRNGSFKTSITIDDGIEPRQVARFPSGEFLIYGIDNATQSTGLALLNPDGTILRFLSTPRPSKKTNNRLRQEIPGLPKNYAAVPTAQMTLFQGNILVISEGTREPVLEVSSAGNIRRVHIQLPNEDVIQGFLPSPKRWYVTTVPDVPSGTFVDSSKSMLFEVNPDDGTVLNHLELQKATIGDLACAEDDQFIAFRHDKEGKLTAMTGSVVK